MITRLSIASRIWLLAAVVGLLGLIVFGISIWKTGALTDEAVAKMTERGNIEAEVQMKAIAQVGAQMIGAAVADLETEQERRELTRKLLQSADYFGNEWEEKQSGYYFIFTYAGETVAHPMKP